MSEFPTVRIYDPAIQPWDHIRKTGTKLVDWGRERDMAKLVTYPGATPVVFHCRRLTRSQMLFVSKAPDEVTQHDRAFALGVIGVDRPEQPPWKPAGVGARDYFAMSEAELESFEFTDIQEIGGVILTRSRVPLDLSPVYPVQPSSLAVLDAVVSRFVARSLADAAQNKTAPGAPPGS